jgi:hypothetical protein
MLADRTLLGATLALTFLSGGTVGYMANASRAPERVNPYAVEVVFEREIGELQQRGFSEAELAEARGHYESYLAEYRHWWEDFCEANSDSLDLIDERLEGRMEELGERARERAADEENGESGR